MRMIDTGYEGGDEKKDEPVKFDLELYQHQHTRSGLLCRVKRDGEWIGVIQVRNVREFKWLRAGIFGTMRPEEELHNDDLKKADGDDRQALLESKRKG